VEANPAARESAVEIRTAIPFPYHPVRYHREIGVELLADLVSTR